VTTNGPIFALIGTSTVVWVFRAFTGFAIVPPKLTRVAPCDTSRAIGEMVGHIIPAQFFLELSNFRVAIDDQILNPRNLGEVL
jgi:hypothetical protein